MHWLDQNNRQDPDLPVSVCVSLGKVLTAPSFELPPVQRASGHGFMGFGRVRFGKVSLWEGLG